MDDMTFVDEFGEKAELKVKVSQNRFFIKSHVFKVRDNEQKIDCGNFKFVVDRLNEYDRDEKFGITLLLNRTSIPVSNIVKELLYDEEMKQNSQYKLQAQEKIQVTCLDSKGRRIHINFKVSKNRNEDLLLPMEREGHRILVGKFVILDKRKICRVKSANKGYSFDIQVLNTGELMKDMPESRLTPMEKYGVNVYDLNSMPY